MKDEKAILREEARKHRSRTDFSEENPERAAELFWQALEPSPDQIIAGYWPKGREFDCINILEQAHEKGHKCALPVVKKGTLMMRFHQWTPETEMVNGAFDIPEPKDTKEINPDIVIVPLLAFDRRGARLGQGGGYYDTTLQKMREEKEMLAIGAAYASQAVLFNLPAEEHDQRLDMVVTPKDIHDFRKRKKSD